MVAGISSRYADNLGTDRGQGEAPKFCWMVVGVGAGMQMTCLEVEEQSDAQASSAGWWWESVSEMQMTCPGAESGSGEAE